MRALLIDGDGTKLARVGKEKTYPFTQIATLATVPACRRITQYPKARRGQNQYLDGK